jgi:hypothetical protein
VNSKISAAKEKKKGKAAATFAGQTGLRDFGMTTATRPVPKGKLSMEAVKGKVKTKVIKDYTVYSATPAIMPPKSPSQKHTDKSPTTKAKTTTKSNNKTTVKSPEKLTKNISSNQARITESLTRTADILQQEKGHVIHRTLNNLQAHAKAPPTTVSQAAPSEPAPSTTRSLKEWHEFLASPAERNPNSPNMHETGPPKSVHTTSPSRSEKKKTLTLTPANNSPAPMILDPPPILKIFDQPVTNSFDATLFSSASLRVMNLAVSSTPPLPDPHFDFPKDDDLPEFTIASPAKPLDTEAPLHPDVTNWSQSTGFGTSQVFITQDLPPVHRFGTTTTMPTKDLEYFEEDIGRNFRTKLSRTQGGDNPSVDGQMTQDSPKTKNYVFPPLKSHLSLGSLVPQGDVSQQLAVSLQQPNLYNKQAINLSTMPDESTDSSFRDDNDPECINQPRAHDMDEDSNPPFLPDDDGNSLVTVTEIEDLLQDHKTIFSDGESATNFGRTGYVLSDSTEMSNSPADIQYYKRAATQHTDILSDHGQDEPSCFDNNDDMDASSGNLSDATNVQKNEIFMSDDEDDEEEDSDDDDDLACPEPRRDFFWRYDLVVSIPANTNPSLAVATSVQHVLEILQGLDKDVIIYPFRACSKPAIVQPTALLTLNRDTQEYIDKGHFSQFPGRATPNCRLAVALGSSLSTDALCEEAMEVLRPMGTMIFAREMNYPSIGRAGFLLYSHRCHHSNTFRSELQRAVTKIIATKWR